MDLQSLRDNQAMFDQLLGSIGPRVERRFWGYLDAEEVDSILGESLGRAWNHLEIFDSLDSLRGWVFTTAIRLGLDLLRRKARRLEVPLDAAAGSILAMERTLDLSEYLRHSRQYNDLMRVLASLSRREREIVLHHATCEARGRTGKNIAPWTRELSRRWKIKPETLRGMHVRVMAKIRRELCALGYAELLGEARDAE